MKRFHTYYDFNRYFDKYIEFMTFSWDIKKNLLGPKECKKLAKVKNLENIEIHEPHDEEMINVINQMDNLKEVIIGSFEFIKTCTPKIFKALENKTILTSLAILNIDGR
mgnify:CR=1 FL=1